MKQFYMTRKSFELFSKIFLLQFFILLTSCENEKYDLSLKSESKNSEFELKNGRLYFSSKELFVESYTKYVNLPEEELGNKLMPLYKKGFYSLRPYVTAENEEFLYNIYKDKINLGTPGRTPTAKGNGFVVPAPTDPPVTEDPLGPVEFIGDDTFALYLNIDGEIQIGEDIYKYTDVGLFIADETEYVTLEDYLGSTGVSDDPFVETELRVRDDLTLVLPENLPTPIGAGNVVYYRPASYQSTTPTSPYTTTPGSAVSNDPSYYSFLSNLSSCDPHSGLFGNLFGDNDVCIDHYENKRRVKTKAFNYNYFLVYHMGVKCVHQFRGWTGFWRVEATDEIRLVVEAAMFEYDVDKLLGNSVISNNSQIKDFYYENKKLSYGPNNINIPGQLGFSYTNLDHSALPQIFQNTGMGLSFEWFGTGVVSLDNLVQNGINSNLNAKKVNEHFYNFAYNYSKDFIRSHTASSSYTPPPNRTFGAKFPENGKILIQKSVVDQGTNIGVREKTFDWGAELKFNAKASGDGSWNVSAGQGSLIARPKNFRVKIIGAARKGSAWHGSKFSVGID